MIDVLVAVDLQNDFIDGALGTKEAVAIVEKAKEKIESFPGVVLFTRDTHNPDYMETEEGKHLPVPHCIKGSKGWEIREELDKLRKTDVIDKPTFGSVELMEFIDSIIDNEANTNIEFVGLCTDICVISNAIMAKAYFPEANISVNSNLCAGTSIEAHDNALKAMHQCQINII